MAAHGHHDGSAWGALIGVGAFLVEKIFNLVPHPEIIELPLMDIHLHTEDVHNVLMAMVCAGAGWGTTKFCKWVWDGIVHVFKKKK